MNVSLIQAFILGVIQGITEFLPISSSGHLVLAQTFFGMHEPPVTFDIILHAGSLVAIVLFLPKRISHISWSLIKNVGVGTVPAVIVGLLILPIIEPLFSSLWLLAVGFFLSGWLLLQTAQYTQGKIKLNHISLKDAFIIGSYQAAAILPSLSRSGSTIYAALSRGITRQAAFTFSFLLAVPAIVGATVTQIPSLASVGPNDYRVVTVGFITACLTSLFALKILEWLVLSNKLIYFAYYCFLIGGLSIWLAFFPR